MDSAFVIERSYNAPRKKVWRAITNKEDMKQWYFDLPNSSLKLDSNSSLREEKKMASNTFIVAGLRGCPGKKAYLQLAIRRL
jgi:hypothetical protein